MLRKLIDLCKLAKNIPNQKIAVVAADDEVVIEAINEALKLGIISPILFGNSSHIQAILHSKGYDANKYQIIESSSPENAVLLAVEMIRLGKADILMKGLIDTKALLKAVVNSESGIKEAEVLSHVALLSFSDWNRVLFATDCAMNIAPGIEEKIAIIRNAVHLANALGYYEPKVGLVSCVEKVNPKIQSTVDASEITSMYRLGMIPGCMIDGPFAVDNLVSVQAASHKQIDSKVAGSADILVFPNLDSGNVFYKTSVFLAKADVAGIVVGAKVPIVLTSRADSPKSKLFSILLAMVYNYGKSDIGN